MLVCLSSLNGSPGVSCWSMVLAAAWPHRFDRILVEADCSGGVVSARYGLPAEPGAAELVVHSRGGSLDAVADLATVARLVRRPSGTEEALWVVPGPITAHDNLAIWLPLAQQAAASMIDDQRLWVVDCGRVWPRSPIEHLLATANYNLIVANAEVESLVALPARVASLEGPVGVIVVGKTNYSVAELQDFTGTAHVWKVPFYQSMAAKVSGLVAENRKGHRSPLWSAALSIAHELAGYLPSETGPAPVTDHAHQPGRFEIPQPPQQPGRSEMPQPPHPPGPPQWPSPPRPPDPSQPIPSQSPTPVPSQRPPQSQAQTPPHSQWITEPPSPPGDQISLNGHGQHRQRGSL